jgi:peptidoglycan/LPS O-acetylase OafA/YrhL
VGAEEAGRRGSRHLAYIDGLRCVAVLAVIAYHLNQSWLPGGFAGVDVFFVISGFVVSASLAGFVRPSLWEYLTYFYSRRIRRIAPALVVCLLATAVATALLIPSAWLSNTNDGTGFRAFFGISNFWLSANTGDYFSPKTEFNPYTQTWSLGVEEQFYVIFPLLFFGWSYFRSRRWLLSAGFAAALAVSLGFAAHVGQSVEAFYMLSSRFWELAAGSLLFQLLQFRFNAFDGRSPHRDSIASVGATLACVALGFGLWTARADHTPFPDGLLPVLGTLGCLGFLYVGHPAVLLRRMLESRGMVAIGKASYSLYLWHWPVFVLFRWTVGLEGILYRFVALAITFAAAFASYRYVERPFRYAATLIRAPRWAVVVVGLGAVVASAAVYHEITRLQPALSLSVVSANAADWYPDRPPQWAAPRCSGLETAVPGGGSLAVFAKPCASATSTSGKRLFVVGDSHAIAYQSMLAQAASRTGRTVYLYTDPGCGAFRLLAVDYEDSRCRQFAMGALRAVTSIAREGDVLFLPSLRLPRLSEQWATFSQADARKEAFDPSVKAGRTKATVLAIEELRPLEQRGVFIVLEAPTPVLKAPPFRCADGFTRSNPICDAGLSVNRRLLNTLRAPVLASYHRMGLRLKRLSVWDPFPVLCPKPVCQGMRGSTPLFFDADHVSGYANTLLLPSFLGHLNHLGTPGP